MLTFFQTAFVTFIFAICEADINLPHPLSDEFIDLINAKQDLWKAGRNFPQNTPYEHIKRRIGAIHDDDGWKRLPVKTHNADLIASLPETFDPRDKWQNCSSLNEIRDQGSCGGSWAFGAVEAMTDRVCIFSNSTKNVHYSADDLISCCTKCGIGCDGGVGQFAWEYWLNEGLVSGGNYNSKQGCKPYKFPPCNHYGTSSRKACTRDHPPTPKCVNTCQPNYNVPYDKDKSYASNVYAVYSNEDHIKAELYTNGPAEALFNVYTDFLSYKSGVYKHTHGAAVGGHAVKIMGWGVEKGVKYWLAANSWNTEWGDKGFFKILRGEDGDCDIESFVIAGEPEI